MVTTTLCVVLFTTIVLGGGTLPLMKYLESRGTGVGVGGRVRNRRKGRRKDIALSKTLELGTAIESEYLSELTEEEMETSFTEEGGSRVKGFMFFDMKYLRPFFTRR